MCNISIFAKKQLLWNPWFVAQDVPFKPKYAKLERDLEISRNTLPNYILYLEKAGLIALLREKTSGIKVLEKIEKVYLNNPNENYVIAEGQPNIGTIRETIFLHGCALIILLHLPQYLILKLTI